MASFVIQIAHKHTLILQQKIHQTYWWIFNLKGKFSCTFACEFLVTLWHFLPKICDTCAVFRSVYIGIWRLFEHKINAFLVLFLCVCQLKVLLTHFAIQGYQ